MKNHLRSFFSRHFSMFYLTSSHVNSYILSLMRGCKNIREILSIFPCNRRNIWERLCN